MMTGNRSAHRRVLVIDDDPVTLAMASDFLDEAGFQVVTATCPVYSNHLIFNAQPPALILMDVMMPLMPGDKKVRLLKSRDKSSQIPILLMSSKEEAELQQLADNAGADGYLTKPFNADRLVNKVAATLTPKAP